MGPLISVVIPVYNAEQYIERSIESVLNQSYEPIQIVVVDDGSTDGSVRVAEGFRDNRIKIVCQENQGAFMARLAGVRASDGELIGFVDSDDCIDREMYSRLYHNLERFGADISHCGYRMIRKDVERLYYGTGVVVEQEHDAGLRDLLEGKFIEPTLCTKLYRKYLFDGISISERIDVLEDLLMNFLLFSRAKKSIYEDVVLYSYLKREQSSGVRSREKELEDYRIGISVLRSYGRNPAIEPYIERYAFRRWISLYHSGLTSPEQNRILPEKPDCRFSALDAKQKIQYLSITWIPRIYDLVYRQYFKRRYGVL